MILTQSIEEQSLPLGRRTSGERVLENVRVVAVDQQLVRGATTAAEGQGAKTVTLEVTPEQAERVAVAVRIGKVNLVVRAADPQPNAEGPPNPADASPARTTWASDVSPALGARGPVLRVFPGAAESKEYRFQ